MQAGEVMLPLCIPKQSKLFHTTVHPHAVSITVEVRAPITGTEEGNVATRERTTEFFAHPEWLAPTAKPVTPDKATAAIADSSEPDLVDLLRSAGVAENVKWEHDGKHELAMHPFWAVRRLTEKQLLRERYNQLKVLRSIRFRASVAIWYTCLSLLSAWQGSKELP